MLKNSIVLPKNQFLKFLSPYMISTKRINPVSRVKIPHVSNDVMGSPWLWAPTSYFLRRQSWCLVLITEAARRRWGSEWGQAAKTLPSWLSCGLSHFIQNSCRSSAPVCTPCPGAPKINRNGKFQLYHIYSTRNHERDLIWDVFITASFNHPFHAGFHQQPTLVKSEVAEARLLCELT